jgi:hypothetical protein
MYSKGYVNTILIVLVVFLAGVVGYLTLIGKSTLPTVTNTNQALPANIPAQQNLPNTSSAPTVQVVNWQSLMSDIRLVLGPKFLGVRVEENHPLSIFQTNDITGDGVPEALVSLGTGGAYADMLVLMRIENNKPVVAQFKQKDGKIASLIFLAGASARHNNVAMLLPSKNAIYSGSWDTDDFGKVNNCNIDAYQWNPQTKTFDYNANLNVEVKLGFCQKKEE